MSHVAPCGNTAKGGGTLPINNETLCRTENCLPSSSGDNDVSLAARGNSSISIKKECQRVADGQKGVVGAHRIIHRNFVVNITMNGLANKRGEAVLQPLIMTPLVVEIQQEETKINPSIQLNSFRKD